MVSLNEINSQSDEPSFWSKIRGSLAEFIEFVAVAAAILILARFFIAEPHKVSGSSMVPNFIDSDYILTNKIPVYSYDFKRGEVIILHNPRNPDEVFIKRIVGLPSEKIKIFNRQIYINGQPLSEPYLPEGLKTPGESFLTEGEEITIPDNQFFVIGDNRPASSDSREWGTLKKELIVGQAFIRYWPPQGFKIIKVNEKSNY